MKGIFVPENGHTPKRKPAKPVTPSAAKRKLPTEEHCAKKVCCMLKLTIFPPAPYIACYRFCTLYRFFPLSCRGSLGSLVLTCFRLRSKHFTTTGKAKQPLLRLRLLTRSLKRSVFFCAMKEWRRRRRGHIQQENQSHTVNTDSFSITVGGWGFGSDCGGRSHWQNHLFHGCSIISSITVNGWKSMTCSLIKKN